MENKHREPNFQADGNGGGERRGRGRPRSTNNPSNDSTENGGTATGGSFEDIQIGGKEDSGLSSVKQDTKIPETTSKGRGRPKGSGSSSVSKKTAGKSHDLEQTKFMIQTLLSVGFNISAARLGDHWRLADHESSALAEPIAAIMDRHDLTGVTGAYGEYIALIAAIGMIIVPKVMITIEINKQKGAKPNYGLQVVSKSQQTAEPAKPVNPVASAPNGDSGQVQERSTSYTPSDVKQSLAYLG